MATSAVVMKKSKARDRALGLRENFWPDLKEGDLWDRKKNHGWTTVPRTLPLIMAAIDGITKNKPAGQTYLVLWFRAFDEMILVIENPSLLAAESGFSGERALTTWRSRMKKLKELGFIDAQPGPSGPFHYVLLKNPHKVMWSVKSKAPVRVFGQLMDRALEVGANDFKKVDAKGEAVKPQPSKPIKAAAAPS